MKLSKILTPALAIVTVTGVTAPIVTSCNKTNWGGTTVTEEEFDSALDYFIDASHTENYTVSSTAVNNGVTTIDNMKVVNEKEYDEEIEDGKTHKSYFVYATEYKEYNAETKGWDTASSTPPATMMATIAFIVAALKASKGFASLNFHDGAYWAETTSPSGETAQLGVAIANVNSNKRVVALISNAPSSSSTIKLSNYGDTKLPDDFPAYPSK